LRIPVDILLKYAALRNECKSIRPHFSGTRRFSSNYFPSSLSLSLSLSLSPPHIIKQLFITVNARLQYLFRNTSVCSLLFEIEIFIDNVHVFSIFFKTLSLLLQNLKFTCHKILFVYTEKRLILNQD